MTISVYLSVGRAYTPAHEKFIADFERHLQASGLTPRTVGRNYYKNKEPLKTIAACMRECSGVVVLAFERFRITDGLEMPGSTNEMRLQGVRLPTVWNQIEAAMAYSLGKPLLVIMETNLRGEGLLQHGYEWYILSAPLNQSLFADSAFAGLLTDWMHDLGLATSQPGSPSSSLADVDLTKIGVGELLAKIKVGQLWTAGVAVASILAGAATLGYRAAAVIPHGANPPAASAGAPLICERQGVGINQRVDMVDSTQNVVVSGRADSLPDGFRLWVVATGPSGSRSYWPRVEAPVQGKTWSVALLPRVNAKDRQKHFAVYMAGQDGQALIDTYRSSLGAVATENKWPALSRTTSDLIECPGRHEVQLR